MIRDEVECHSLTPVVSSGTTRDCNDTESSALIMLFRRYQDNNNISVIFPHNSPELLYSGYTAQIKIEKYFGDLHNITTAIPVDLTSRCEEECHKNISLFSGV